MRALALVALLLGCTPVDDGVAGREPAIQGSADEEASCTELSVELELDADNGVLPLEANMGARISCEADGAVAVGWDFGDGQTALGASTSHTWLGTGVFEVFVSVTDAEGNIAEDRVEVTVRAPACPEVEDAEVVGTLESDELDEASGLVQGRLDPAILWTHNDSGDGPRLFALDHTGETRAIFELAGAPEGDWEDIAIGRDAEGSPVLFVGDIGANGQDRDALVVYVFSEPAMPADGGTVELTEWTAVDLIFPEGEALNADTLMWDPVHGALYLAAQEDDELTGIYRTPAPFEVAEQVSLEHIASLDLGAIGTESVATGGEISPLGDRIVLRTADEAWLWLRDQSAGIDAVWDDDVCPLPVAEEPRGEAIAFSIDGDGYFTLSEETHQPIYFTPFVPPEKPCEGMEARILASEVSGSLPFAPTLEPDDTCIPAGIASVRWTFDDGQTSTAWSPPLEFLGSGIQRIYLSVVDSDGESDDTSIDLEVLPGARPVPGETEEWGSVETEELNELSGLGHSALNPGVLWAHNDSGDSSRIFALAEDGTHLGEFDIDASSRDWEDLALGWDDTLGGPSIYIGDVGDNGESRDDITVVVVPEPELDELDVDGSSDESIELTGAHSFTLTYPDGPHNCESILVDPVSGDLLIITKDYEGETAVFRKAAPHEADSETELELIAELAFGTSPLSGSGATTGADFSPLGDRIAVRTYSDVYMFRRDRSASLAEAFETEPCDLSAPSERQGEAIAMSVDGAGYFLVSEGDHQPVFYTPLD